MITPLKHDHLPPSFSAISSTTPSPLPLRGSWFFFSPSSGNVSHMTSRLKPRSSPPLRQKVFPPSPSFVSAEVIHCCPFLQFSPPLLTNGVRDSDRSRGQWTCRFPFPPLDFPVRNPLPLSRLQVNTPTLFPPTYRRFPLRVINT